MANDYKHNIELQFIPIQKHCEFSIENNSESSSRIKNSISKHSSVCVGTTSNSDIRLADSTFPEKFEIFFWIDSSDHRKCKMRLSNNLKCETPLKRDEEGYNLFHGDQFEVKMYAPETQQYFQLCRGKISRDICDNAPQNEWYYVNVTNHDHVTLGCTSSCTIYIPNTGSGDCVELSSTGNDWIFRKLPEKCDASVNCTCAHIGDHIDGGSFFDVFGHRFYAKIEDVNGKKIKRIFFFDSSIFHHNPNSVQERLSSSNLVYPHLNKGTRFQYKLPEKTIQIKNPSSKPDSSFDNVVVTIFSSLARILVMLLLACVIGRSMRLVVFSIAMSIVSIAGAFFNRHRRKQEQEKKIAKRETVYNEMIERKKKEIEAFQKEEKHYLQSNNPGITKYVDAITNFSCDLFDHDTSDPDFLCVRIGVGSQKSNCVIKSPEMDEYNADDPLFQKPTEIADKYQQLEDVPVTIDLKTSGSILLLGNKQKTSQVAKLVMMNLMLSHSYQDLQIGLILPDNKEYLEEWKWMRWPRHVVNESISLKNIAYNKDNFKNLMDFYYGVLCERENVKKKDEQIFDVNYVVFFFHTFDIMQHPISRFVYNDQYLGFTFIFIGDKIDLLPRCKTILEVGERNRIYDTSNTGEYQELKLDSFDDSETNYIARKLACIKIDKIDAGRQLPPMLSFYRMLNIKDSADLDISQYWSQADVSKSIKIPLGIGPKGDDDIIYIDIHEKKDGVHGLLAGTTGSGKSILLETFILSLAIHYPPDEVAFLIIDFKAGGMSSQFEETSDSDERKHYQLPHLLGTITDLEGNELDRSLKSIRAEQEKRKRLFKEAHVNHIDAYAELYRDGQVDIPLPHLILVIDELAELKDSHKEFMKELDSIARVGRSLGIFMLLAAQKPDGVISQQLEANSRYRLCLKVASPNDSKAVLKNPLAAELSDSGRCYLKVGSGEEMTLFQSAYCEAPIDSELVTDSKSITISKKNFDGTLVSTKIIIGNTETDKTVKQLDSIVQKLEKCWKNEYKDRYSKLKKICIPPLKEVIEMPKKIMEGISKTEGCIFELGEYDNPDQQLQTSFRVNLSLGNLLIIGNPQAGKTNILRLIIKQLSMRYSTDEVLFYLFDYASQSLSTFDGLPHICSIVKQSDQEEDVRKIITKLVNEVSIRKDVFTKMGITSYRSYLESGKSEENFPQIVVILDNFYGFKELFLTDAYHSTATQKFEANFLMLLREGTSLGISFVVSSPQTTPLSYRYMSNFTERIALNCIDPTEYAQLFGIGHGKLELKNNPGRCFVEKDRKLYHCQAYLAFSGENEVIQSKAIREFVEHQAKNNSVNEAYKLSVPVKTITIPELKTKMNGSIKPYHVFLGIDKQTNEVKMLDLFTAKIFGVCARDIAQAHRICWISNLLKTLEEQQENYPFSVYLVDDESGTLRDFSEKEYIEEYSQDPEDAVRFLNGCFNAAKQRRESDSYTLEDVRESVEGLVLLILNSEKAVECAFDEWKNWKKDRETLLESGICIISSNIENRYSTKPDINLFVSKSNPNVLLFEDIEKQGRMGNKTLKEKDSLHSKFPVALKANEAFYICGDEWNQIVIPSN